MGKSASYRPGRPEPTHDRPPAAGDRAHAKEITKKYRPRWPISNRFRITPVYHVPEEYPVITAIVRFPLPAAVTADKYREMSRHAAPDFRKAAGLLSKHFLLAEDGRGGGGVYLWESREAAETFYASGFLAMIRERFGAEPQITYFETPVVVDNRAV
jgi:hypothetical protein